MKNLFTTSAAFGSPAAATAVHAVAPPLASSLPLPNVTVKDSKASMVAVPVVKDMSLAKTMDALSPKSDLETRSVSPCLPVPVAPVRLDSFDEHSIPGPSGGKDLETEDEPFASVMFPGKDLDDSRMEDWSHLSPMVKSCILRHL